MGGFCVKAHWITTVTFGKPIPAKSAYSSAFQIACVLQLHYLIFKISLAHRWKLLNFPCHIGSWASSQWRCLLNMQHCLQPGPSHHVTLHNLFYFLNFKLCVYESRPHNRWQIDSPREPSVSLHTERAKWQPLLHCSMPLHYVNTTTSSKHLEVTREITKIMRLTCIMRFF